MKSFIAALLFSSLLSAPKLLASELDRLRSLVSEQEMQIAQLEEKIARLNGSAPAEPKQSVAAANEKTYTVVSGDSLERIANRNRIAVASLASMNGLKPNSIIHPGQKLKIESSVNPTAGSINEVSSVPEKTYKIQSGDTLYKISKKFGVTVSAIQSLNPTLNPKALKIGQKIVVSKAVDNQFKASSNSGSSKPADQSSASIPVSQKPLNQPKLTAQPTPEQPVKVTTEITYDEFAKNYNTTTERLDEINGLDLDPSTVLAQGSELYIP